MPRKIIWAPLAEKDFITILDYLHENWDDSVVQNFIGIVDNLISQIILNPKQFPLIKKKSNVRRCVLTKHNTLFYLFGKDTIAILRIFDNRQDPNKLIFNVSSI